MIQTGIVCFIMRIRLVPVTAHREMRASSSRPPDGWRIPHGHRRQFTTSEKSSFAHPAVFVASDSTARLPASRRPCRTALAR